MEMSTETSALESLAPLSVIENEQSVASMETSRSSSIDERDPFSITLPPASVPVSLPVEQTQNMGTNQAPIKEEKEQKEEDAEEDIEVLQTKVAKLRKLLAVAKNGIEQSQQQIKRKDADFRRATSRIAELEGALEQSQKEKQHRSEKASEMDSRKLVSVRKRVNVDQAVWCLVEYEGGKLEWSVQNALFAAGKIPPGLVLPPIDDLVSKSDGTNNMMTPEAKIKKLQEQVEAFERKYNNLQEEYQSYRVKVDLYKRQKEAEINTLIEHSIMSTRKKYSDESDVDPTTEGPLKQRLEALQYQNNELKEQLKMAKASAAKQEDAWKTMCDNLMREKEEVRQAATIDPKLVSKYDELKREFEAMKDRYLKAISRKDADILRLEKIAKASLNMEYVKNIVVKYLETPDPEVRESLLPVLATVLKFSQHEMDRIRTQRQMSESVWSKASSLVSSFIPAQR
eukprot:GILJ01003621.1.p1 GENE.GILJ01003621.1~~GILJ01003621.1.p1  ORF type:complete len:456 (+),score=90.26 GILJ01003621.1:66-1433(+)